MCIYILVWEKRQFYSWIVVTMVLVLPWIHCPQELSTWSFSCYMCSLTQVITGPYECELWNRVIKFLQLEWNELHLWSTSLIFRLLKALYETSQHSYARLLLPVANLLIMNSYTHIHIPMEQWFFHNYAKKQRGQPDQKYYLFGGGNAVV